MHFIQTQKFSVFWNKELHFFNGSMIFELRDYMIQKHFHYENWITEKIQKNIIYICIWPIQRDGSLCAWYICYK